jgi:hypothetical protein
MVLVAQLFRYCLDRRASMQAHNFDREFPRDKQAGRDEGGRRRRRGRRTGERGGGNRTRCACYARARACVVCVVCV